MATARARTMAPMDIHDLRVFAEVARTLHYTRAAQALGLTQPAISARIAALERSLGTRLLTRSGRGMRLTAAGEVLSREAHAVLERVEAARRAVEEVQGLVRGRVRVGASSTPGAYLVPVAAARFTKAHPGVSLEVRVGNTLQMEEAILRGDLHVAVVGGHLASRDVSAEPICEDEILLFVAPGHPLAGKRGLQLRDVVAHPFCMRESGSATRRRLEDLLAEHGLAPVVGVELGGAEAVKHAVAEGTWVGALSRFALRWDLDSGRLVALKVRGVDLRRPLSVALAKDAVRTRALDEWIAALREAAGA